MILYEGVPIKVYTYSNRYIIYNDEQYTQTHDTMHDKCPQTQWDTNSLSTVARHKF